MTENHKRDAPPRLEPIGLLSSTAVKNRRFLMRRGLAKALVLVILGEPPHKWCGFLEASRHKKLNTSIIFAAFLLIFLISPVNAEITSFIDDYEGCEYRWLCSNWNPSECPENGIQKRSCTNAGICPDDYNKPEETQNCITERPSELFDITFELESYEFPTSGDLVAWIRFESFGTDPTPVNLTYTIYDKDNNPFFIKHDNLTVETERFIVQRFSSLRLKPGPYSLVLETFYGNDVEDVFKKEFKVRKETSTIFALIGFIFIALIMVMIYLYKINEKSSMKPKKNRK